ncbi:MAG: hypothetical protein AB8B50_01425 [Pirellulaceae bacterium]
MVHSRIKTWINLVACAVATLTFTVAANAQEAVYSGPQPAEKLPSFKAFLLRGDSIEKNDVDGQKTAVDPIKLAGSEPVVLIFWHQLGRPGFALLRTITQYSLSKTDDGLRTSVCLLTDDPEAKKFQGAIRLLPPKLSVSVPEGGADGPGSYGLNRNVRMTILIGKAGKVTDNFALVQPSVKVDAPKIAAAIAKALGQEPPSDEKLLATNARMRGTGTERAMKKQGDGKSALPDEALQLLRTMLRSESEQEIKEAAAKMESIVAKNPAARSDLSQRATRIVNSGNLKRYGIKLTQDYIKKWAKPRKDTKEAKSDSEPAAESRESKKEDPT